jgi:hypothetical protein
MKKKWGLLFSCFGIDYAGGSVLEQSALPELHVNYFCFFFCLDAKETKKQFFE